MLNFLHMVIFLKVSPFYISISPCLQTPSVCYYNVKIDIRRSTTYAHPMLKNAVSWSLRSFLMQQVKISKLIPLLYMEPEPATFLF